MFGKQRKIAYDFGSIPIQCVMSILQTEVTAFSPLKNWKYVIQMTPMGNGQKCLSWVKLFKHRINILFKAKKPYEEKSLINSSLF